MPNRLSLRSLDAEFLRHLVRDGMTYHVPVESILQADGVIFLCPLCFTNNKGPIGTHSVICWQPQIPVGISPGPGRWTFSGTGLDDLTLTAASSSILLSSGCRWHGYVRKGCAEGGF